MMYEPRVCGICGAKFTPTVSNQLYCSKECSNKARIRSTINNRKKRKELRLTLDKTSMSIGYICIQAKKHGMSYGQYVAQMKEED